MDFIHKQIIALHPEGAFKPTPPGMFKCRRCCNNFSEDGFCPYNLFKRRFYCKTCINSANRLYREKHPSPNKRKENKYYQVWLGVMRREREIRLWRHETKRMNTNARLTVYQVEEIFQNSLGNPEDMTLQRRDLTRLLSLDNYVIISKKDAKKRIKGVENAF